MKEDENLKEVNVMKMNRDTIISLKIMAIVSKTDEMNSSDKIVVNMIMLTKMI